MMRSARRLASLLRTETAVASVRVPGAAVSFASRAAAEDADARASPSGELPRG